MSLARALVSKPNLLLLDEPFSALDALTRIEMHRLVALWKRHRPGVLLVTHDVDEALALADRVLVLDQGQVAAQWSLAVPRGRRNGDPQISPSGPTSWRPGCRRRHPEPRTERPTESGAA